MPTSRCRPFTSSCGDVTSCPQTRMRPSSIVSSRLMQRSAVLFPEPLRPMIATTEPARIWNDTPSSTTAVPKRLRTASTSTMGDIELAFEAAAPGRERIAQREVQRCDQHEDDERAERRVVDHLAGAHQLDEADRRGERGVLDDLH